MDQTTDLNKVFVFIVIGLRFFYDQICILQQQPIANLHTKLNIIIFNISVQANLQKHNSSLAQLFHKLIDICLFVSHWC